MSIPVGIAETILEWTNEGHEYLYLEEPERMTQLELFLKTCKFEIDGDIYRRTDFKPILTAQKGDSIDLNRVSSWSTDLNIVNAKYENMISVLLILGSEIVNGLDVSHLSSHPDESEILLAPIKLFVIDRTDDVLTVKVI